MPEAHGLNNAKQHPILRLAWALASQAKFFLDAAVN
ncbi:hypothetical protein GGR41_002196 [Paenalcaligenes hominis]|uniref:Uncharacterized protein n=1 Tax=Paenalcaligenes hominis TaxID=643674 RepID=A0ABX0WT44_9BURK|nr:hypothetical protein [Paenalcaligenes hominis]